MTPRRTGFPKNSSRWWRINTSTAERSSRNMTWSGGEQNCRERSDSVIEPMKLGLAGPTPCSPGFWTQCRRRNRAGYSRSVRSTRPYASAPPQPSKPDLSRRLDSHTRLTLSPAVAGWLMLGGARYRELIINRDDREAVSLEQIRAFLAGSGFRLILYGR